MIDIEFFFLFDGIFIRNIGLWYLFGLHRLTAIERTTHIPIYKIDIDK